MPHDRLNGSAVGLRFADFCTPEFSDELEIFLVVEVHLACLVVLVLWMVNHFCWDFLSSEAPDALNVKFWLVSDDAHSCESVLSEVVESLEEALHQVFSLVEDLTFVSVLVVVEEPERVAFWVVLLLQGSHTASSLVLVVDHESLEVEEVPVTRWESFKRVDVFLGWLLFSFLLLGLWLGLLLLLLLLSSVSTAFLELRLDSFWSNLDATEDCFEGWLFHDALEPFVDLLAWFAEAFIKSKLAGKGEDGSDHDVSNGDVVTNEPS